MCRFWRRKFGFSILFLRIIRWRTAAIAKHGDIVSGGAEKASMFAEDRLHTADDRPEGIVDQCDPHGAFFAARFGMRFVALLIVVAIIYILVSKHASTSSSPELKESISAVDSNLPPQPAQRGGAAPAPAAAPARTDYKRALDRANAVVNEVHRQQNEQ
jgi:hypothetical protein